MSDVIMYYEGDCELCSRRVAFFRKYDTENHVAWQNISESMDGLGISFEEALKQALARDADGKLQRGLDAYITLWAVLPTWRFLSKAIAIAPVKVLLTLYYDFFAARHSAKRLHIAQTTKKSRRRKKNARKK